MSYCQSSTISRAEYVPIFLTQGLISDIIFALKCKGRSMESTLSDGDIVFVKKLLKLKMEK